MLLEHGLPQLSDVLLARQAGPALAAAGWSLNRVCHSARQAQLLVRQCVVDTNSIRY